MRKKLRKVYFGVALGSTAAILLTGCGGAPEPTNGASESYAKSMEDACTAAAAEGQLNYWSASDPEQFAAEVKPFEDAYPDIKVNFTTLRPDEVTQRVVVEAQTGRALSVDATTSDLPSAAPLFDQGLIADVDYKMLGISDDLIAETEGVQTFRVFRDPLGIAYNPESTPESQLPRTWDELASEKWKGKVMIDPRGVYVAGVSAVWGEEKTIDWVDRFIEVADPVVLRGATASLQKVATGEVELSTSATTSAVREQQAAGATVEITYLDIVTVEDKSGMIFNGSENPNAAACFMAWWGSPEGQAMQLEVEYKSNDTVPENLPESAEFAVNTSPESHEAEIRVAQHISDRLG